jgi:integrase
MERQMINVNLGRRGVRLTTCASTAGDQAGGSFRNSSRAASTCSTFPGVSSFAAHCPADWWPFFATLFYTGARLGEAQGLHGGDVLLHAKRLLIHEGSRRVKTKEAVRDLPIAPALEQALAGHLARVGPGPDDLVFPDDAQIYGKVRRTWAAICQAAEIAGATPHDARHTFAAHAAQAGIPIVRLQKLLGHADPTMTMRYMKHAPEAYLDQDAAAIVARMTAMADPETVARTEAARRELKPA